MDICYSQKTWTNLISGWQRRTPSNSWQALVLQVSVKAHRCYWLQSCRKSPVKISSGHLSTASDNHHFCITVFSYISMQTKSKTWEELQLIKGELLLLAPISEKNLHQGIVQSVGFCEKLAGHYISYLSTWVWRQILLSVKLFDKNIHWYFVSISNT